MKPFMCAAALGLFGAFPSHSALAQQSRPSPLWRQALGGAAIAAPAAEAESVAALCDGGVVRVYSRTGRLLWSHRAQGRLSPYIARSPEGTSYVCRTNGLFIALNRIGRELWRANLGGPLAAPVLTGWDGRLFVPTAKRIACYTASGHLLWSRQLNAPPALNPQSDKRGGLIAVTSAGELLILGPYGSVSARKLEEVPAALVPLDAAAARSLAAAASQAAVDRVRAMADEAAARAAEAETAAVRAKEAADKVAAMASAAPADSGAQAAAKQAGEAAAAAAREAAETSRLAGDAAARRPPVFDGNEQTVLALYKNGRAESIRWYNAGEDSFAADFPSLGPAPLGAINRGDAVGAALADGRMLLFSVTEGRTLWSGGSHIAPADSASGAAAATRLIYDERGLYALTASGATGYRTDGKQLWTIQLPDAASPPALSGDGILYAGGSDWVLYAYRMEDSVKARAETRYGPAAEGSYSGGDPRPSPWAEDPNRHEQAAIQDRLETIAAAIRNGRVGADETSYAAYLMEIAGSASQAPANRTRPSVHTQRRAEAARLLSAIGSRETIPFLAEICRNDPDNLVKAAAARAIGSIGVDPEGVALAVFASLVFPLVPGRDEQVMAAIAAATGALCRFSGPPLSESGVRLLSALAGQGPGSARTAALRELASLYYKEEGALKR
ncbi:MAG: PQQ-binding-like beta-propeller repeat protein [Treponema sp.]|nr:PQQ-binding-like beta-propeller repeat protein [Treponema sp.]